MREDTSHNGNVLQDLEYQSKLKNGSGGGGFHVEPNGQIIVVKKPIPERFPKQFVQPLHFDIEDTTNTIMESEFNKTIKEKKA